MRFRFLRLTLLTLLILAFSVDWAFAEWHVDLSRRQKTIRDQELKEDRPPANGPSNERGVFDVLFDSGEPVQEIVILSTEKGFIPSTIRIRKGAKYMLHIVNVNEKEKNVSFVLDAFSEHHATYYGKIKSFRVEAKKEGIFSFQSPETSSEGRLIVFQPSSPGSAGAALRAPTSAPLRDGGETK